MRIFGLCVLGIIFGGMLGGAHHGPAGPGGIGILFDMVVAAFFGGLIGFVIGLIMHFGRAGRRPAAGDTAVKPPEFRNVEANFYELSQVPQTGEWTASLVKGHPEEATFARREHSLTLRKGDSFPEAYTILAGVDANGVRWHMKTSKPTEQPPP